MNKNEIILKENDAGWLGTVGRFFAPEGKGNKIALGENIYYETKEKAWDSIQDQVKKLDYEDDEINFNHQQVKSYDEILELVGQL